MRRASLLRFFVLMFMEVVAANMIHPVTPTFLTNLNMPEFMFGAAFAAMSLTNFLFCPFWGALGDSRGRVKILSITIFGYAVGQLLFLFGTNIWQILLARAVAGIFSGGCTVSLMAYVADTAEPEQCGKHMAVCGALTSAGVCIGYLVGGLMGDISVETAFWAQFVLLISSALGMLLLLKDGNHYQIHKIRFTKAINPLSVFTDSRKQFTKPMLIFLGTVFVSCFASTAYDNSFNYYLKDQFAFPPSYNGYIYALIGVVGITVNMTLGMWLQRHTRGYMPLMVIYLAAAAALLSSLKIQSMLPYIAVNMVFYIGNSMYLPLQQAQAIRRWMGDHGAVSGVFSSIRAAGMVLGSLSAGVLYEFAPLLPMGFCAVCFLGAAALVLYDVFLSRGNK